MLNGGEDWLPSVAPAASTVRRDFGADYSVPAPVCNQIRP